MWSWSLCHMTDCKGLHHDFTTSRLRLNDFHDFTTFNRSRNRSYSAKM